MNSRHDPGGIARSSTGLVVILYRSGPSPGSCACGTDFWLSSFSIEPPRHITEGPSSGRVRAGVDSPHSIRGGFEELQPRSVPRSPQQRLREYSSRNRAFHPSSRGQATTGFRAQTHLVLAPMPECHPEKKADLAMLPCHSGRRSTTVALLNSAAIDVVGSDIAGLVPDGVVSIETRTEQAQRGDSPSIRGG